MGITGLWSELSPVATETTLHKLAVEEGFIKNVSGMRMLRVGVDASAWIFRACYLHGSTKNPELSILFGWCMQLLQLPVLPLFIFDGDRRPKLKRGKAVRGNNHWITQDMQAMLDAFGFAWLKAPGEAEAELAWMNKASIVDAVLTEDSDAVVFGAETILRTPSTDKGEGKIVVYKAADIHAHAAVHLEPADLLLVALVAGGDYSEGLRGCGVQTAIALARAGYGKMLMDGICHKQSSAEASAFLAAWRVALVDEIRTNKSGLLHKCLPVVANTIPLNFPEPNHIDLYLNPVTSVHEQHMGMVAVVAENGPNLVLLAQFVEEHFLWGDLVGILKRFSGCIFPGLALRELLSVARSMDLGLQPSPLVMVGKVHGLRKLSGISAGHAPEARASLVVSCSVIDAINNGLVGKWHTPKTAMLAKKWMDTELPQLRVWLPYAVLDFVSLIHPPLVQVEEPRAVPPSLGAKTRVHRKNTAMPSKPRADAPEDSEGEIGEKNRR